MNDHMVDMHVLRKEMSHPHSLATAERVANQEVEDLVSQYSSSTDYRNGNQYSSNVGLFTGIRNIPCTLDDRVNKMIPYESIVSSSLSIGGDSAPKLTTWVKYARQRSVEFVEYGQGTMALTTALVAAVQ